jgi:hypothetical protein
MLTPRNARTRLLAIPAAALALMTFAASVQAASEESTAIAVREAKVLLNRLSDAAMEACGASTHSVAQYRQAVRDSACWRTSMTDVVQRIDNPYVTAAFEGRYVQQALATQGETTAGGR